ncbi:MAG TPA: hypothetical protein VLE22_05350 [Bryobacteraceae bacterium]|nr:hypothetical protein [Bryobacteraceae bacterium]
MHSLCRVLSVGLAAVSLQAVSLPGGYYRILEAGADKVESRLNAQPDADLKTLESQSGSRHFPYAILAPTVLYAKQHRDNPRYHDPKMLALALRIGDLLASEDEKGTFEPRGDSDWDTYMWLEAYRLLEKELGEERRARWKRAIERNLALLVDDAKARLDFPWYNSPYIGTSPNHYAQWASNLLLAGQVFRNKEWEELGARILQRFATIEQTPDGYWGEHSRRGPTTGYNHLTLTSVALYWELSKDPAALKALRRVTDFHKYFTNPDGSPVEVIDDRNRNRTVSAWGHFAFSNFADGRGYAEFLANFFKPETLTIDQLGRLAQDALYYHDGPKSPAPQEQSRYFHQMEIPAGIRKTGPWVVVLSGIVDTQAINSRFYLDRQGNLGVFHEKLGMIINGGNSKRQPELATFSEKLMGQIVHMPLSSRLQMSDAQDRLSLAYNTFWVDLLMGPPSDKEMSFQVVVNGRGRPSDETLLNLQLVLKSGAVLETGAGRKITLGAERFELSAAELGGLIRHGGWTMSVDPAARLSWPVFPHNPYADAPETSLDQAVGRLTIPLRTKFVPGGYVKPAEQQVRFKITAGNP